MRSLLGFLDFLLPLKLSIALKEKDILSLRLRTGQGLPQFPRRPLWIHAASGEIEYAKPILREIRKANPEVPLLVTYTSPGIKASLKSLSEISFFCQAPWDSPSEWQRFLSHFKPSSLWIARKDVWPEMVYQCQQFSIPSFLFSAPMTRLNFESYGTWSSVRRTTLERLNKIYCVHEEDKEFFLKISDKLQVEAVGDTRFDQVQFRLRHAKPLKENLKPSEDSPVMVAGSTWPLDDEVLLEVMEKIPHLRCIWAPHEVEKQKIESLMKRFAKIGVSYQKYSSAGPEEKWTSRVLLVDEVGLLADLYVWGRVAFVGGSFGEKVHSVMEPLASGIPVVIGPQYLNSREALEFSEIKFSVKGEAGLNDICLVNRALDSDSMALQLRNILAFNPSLRKDIKTVLQTEIEKRSQVSKKLLMEMSDLGFLS